MIIRCLSNDNALCAYYNFAPQVCSARIFHKDRCSLSQYLYSKMRKISFEFCSDFTCVSVARYRFFSGISPIFFIFPLNTAPFYLTCRVFGDIIIPTYLVSRLKERCRDMAKALILFVRKNFRFGRMRG